MEARAEPEELHRELFARRGGDALRDRIDTMSNEEYQRLLRSPVADLRGRLAGDGADRRSIEKVLTDLDDGEVAAAVRDLGGHDLADLLDAFDVAYRATDRPTVLFAYTIKAWGLPTQGHPANHSALLTGPQWEQLGRDLGTDPADPWAPFDDHSAEAALCRDAAARLERPELGSSTPPPVPVELGRAHPASNSTQQAFGRILVDLARDAPEVASRVVTVSPDVASSTAPSRPGEDCDPATTRSSTGSSPPAGPPRPSRSWTGTPTP